MEKVYVYALTDPETNEVRYVGITSQHPSIRFNQHVSNTKTNPNHIDWIQGLKAKGLLPNMETLEELDSWAKATQAEQKWIKYYSRKGCNLTNIKEFCPPAGYLTVSQAHTKSGLGISTITFQSHVGKIVGFQPFHGPFLIEEASLDAYVQQSRWLARKRGK